MFIPIKSTDGAMTPFEYIEAAAGTYQVGQLLNVMDGKLAAIAADQATTPPYVCIFDQSATGFTLGATSGENGTIFKLNYNGVQVASTGTVDLHVKAVNIDGTLTAGALRGGSVSLLAGETSVGSMDLAYTGTGQVGVGLTATYGGMRMTAAGNIYLKSDFGPFALIGKDDASDYNVVSLGGGYLVLSGNYMFGASPPSRAPYGTVFFLEE